LCPTWTKRFASQAKLRSSWSSRAEIFRQILPRAERIYLTRVHAQVKAMFFSRARADGVAGSSGAEDYAADERHAHAYSFFWFSTALSPAHEHLTALPEWRALESHAATVKQQQLRDLFAANPERFAQFSCCDLDLLFDYSRQRVDCGNIEKTVSRWPKRAICGRTLRRMFAATASTTTENRRCCMWRLRNQPVNPL